AEVEAYKKALEDFEVLKYDEFVKKMEEDGDAFILYVGEVDCPYCRHFAPILVDYAKNHKVHVIHVDAEEYDTNDDFVDFLEKHKVETIPAIFVVKDKEAKHFDVVAPYSLEDLEKVLKDEFKSEETEAQKEEKTSAKDKKKSEQSDKKDKKDDAKASKTDAKKDKKN
ncbi:MAG: thioredoxin domain-containing protein, partial [Eubacteriales bacterium]|nr:thioredoxin domain-containing protein [Eubacteriales bacterium]